MIPIDRRLMLGGRASGLASLAISRGNAQTVGQTVGQTAPVTAEGHAAGPDVAPSDSFNPLVPRRAGEAAAFTASLDKAAIKAPSAGWAGEVANAGPGDLWCFPAGHAHAIQTLRDAPCQAILVFNDGLYSEDGTEARAARPLDHGRTHRYRDLRRTTRHV